MYHAFYGNWYIYVSIFHYNLFNRPHGKFGAPVIFSTMLKFSNAQMEQGSTRDAIIDQVYDLLMSFVNSQAHTISYPELIVPLMSILRKFTKECKHSNYSKVMKKLGEMLKENEVYIKEKRAKVNFDVTNVDAVVSNCGCLVEELVLLGCHVIRGRSRIE